MVALFARKGRAARQDGAGSYALHDCRLHNWTTFWTEGRRIRLFDFDVALDDPSHRMGGPWHGHFCQGYFDGSEVAVGFKRCRRTSRLPRTILVRPVDVDFTQANPGRRCFGSGLPRNALVRYRTEKFLSGSPSRIDRVFFSQTEGPGISLIDETSRQ